MSSPLADQSARDQALDISRSFIVQAPAGSGKTGLLTLRYLRLLSVCEQPEQVLAITFTRKAASEMRDRILQTLQWANSFDSNTGTPGDPFDQQRLSIASDVLRKDLQCQWRLLDNPSRLRVQTIDSFCFYLASQLPVLSRIGGNPQISTEVEQCFRDAISNTLSQLDANNSISADIERVQIHLDNDLGRLESLLMDLLYNREQWLPYILEIGSSSNKAREYLQVCLEELVTESISEATSGLQAYWTSVQELANFALENFQREEPQQHAQLEAFSGIPSATSKDRASWLFLLDFLLTKEGGWRRIVNVKNGFPPGDKSEKEFTKLCKQRKQEFLKLRDQLEDSDGLLESLNYVRLLPASSTASHQWDFLTALTRLLAQLSSELLLSFRRFRLIDYTETGAAARASLGNETNPTDLALALDHNIQHILVDEFQDTSQLQLDILQQLTAGWETDGQRSMFLVGDAMQSCYLFRDANVGIYLNVQQNGLPNVAIQPLQLSANFRSQAGVVDWVNKHFATAFPGEANVSRGAVPYAHSTAIKPAEKIAGVSTELITYEKDQRLLARESEAKQVIAHIEELRQSDTAKKESIAILVRSRDHLQSIIQELRSSDIPWESTDIDRMGAMQIIEDLLSLTRAMLNPYDRLSWFAILRAPWLGLTIADLHTIARVGSEQSVWQTVSNYQELNGLSADGKSRLENFTNCISHAMKFRYQIPLRELVETSWNLLRGAAVIESTREAACVSLYFDLLSEHEYAGGLNNLNEFQEKVLGAFIPSSHSQAKLNNETPVQLLTMHKAKGLEFDHVIIAGLANQAPSDKKPLLAWHERLNKQGQPRLLVAALSATGTDDDSLYSLLRHEKQHKHLLENTRLLYIAVTRAKKSAKLFATAALSSKQEIQIPANSLLKRIWRELEREQEELNIIPLDTLISNKDKGDKEAIAETSAPTPIRRFEAPQKLNDVELSILSDLSQQSDYEETLELEADSELSALVGEIIHEELEDFSNCENKNGFLESLVSKKAYWLLRLENCALSRQEQGDALDFIADNIQNTIENAELNWIFDSSHTESYNELSISSMHNGKIASHVIDRTFVDKNNVRWIIDYKSSKAAGNEAEFIDQQIKIYEEQLRRYKNLFGKIEERKIKTALALTSISKLVEVAT